VAAATMTFLEASVFEQPDKVIEINIPICLSGRDSLPDFFVPRHCSS
jgi:hypothetical protein